LVEERLVLGLAALAGEQIDDLVGALHHGVAEAEDAVRALGDRQRAPRLLRAARPRDRLLDLLGRGVGRLADELAGGRRVAADLGARLPVGAGAVARDADRVSHLDLPVRRRTLASSRPTSNRYGACREEAEPG